MSDMDDTLSLGENTDDNFDSDVITDNADKCKSKSTRGKSRVRSGVERKASEASSKSSKKRHVTKKTAENELCLDIDSLKSTLCIDSMLMSISCLSESVKKLTNIGPCMAGSSSNKKMLWNKVIVIINQVQLLRGLQSLLVLIKMMQMIML